MTITIGIDVSKEELSVYVNGEYFSIGNDEKSLDVWLNTNKAILGDDYLFVYEATGGYEKILARYLQKKGLPGCRVHANHVRSYAKAMGILAKTDAIDARVIAAYAETKKVVAKETVAPHPELAALIQRREQLLEQCKQEQNRLETLDTKAVINEIKLHVSCLKRHIGKMEKLIKEYISHHEDVKQTIELLMSIPGVGFITAASIFAYLPELETIGNKPLAALSGLAPMNRDSGKKQGKRKIQGGRAQVRRVLYMATLVATRHNSVIKAFYERLINNGKLFKVAITAAMRKLLTIIRSVVARQTPWQTDRPLAMAA